MKTQAIAFAVLLLAAAAMSANCDQDAGCRRMAVELNIPADLVAKVPTFKLFGQPRNPMTCQDQCNKVNMDIGFDYFGKQACCCGLLM